MRLILALIFLATVATSRSQGFHEHLYVGAFAPEAGTKLLFLETDRLGTNANFVLPLNDLDPLYPGLYQNAVTLSALPATEDTGGPAPGHAAMGSYIQARFVSLHGPSGGRLGLWEENEFGTRTTPLFFINTGTTNGTNRLNVSEGYIYPSTGTTDPYGHIHGRRFTLDRPGLYIVGIQLIDTGTGLNGTGPNHLPSDILYMYFQAGLTIDRLINQTNNWAIRFATQPNFNHHLQATSDLGDTNSWVNIAPVISAHESRLITITDTNQTSSARFYRLKLVPQP